VRLLVVTAVDAERDAVALPDRDGTVLVGGVGPAASAAATSAALATGAHDLVVCAGIGGGFAPLRAGELAVASSVVFADLGAESDDGFEPFEFATDRYPVEPRIALAISDRIGARLGAVLTVATVTGTAARTQALLARFPDAVAEGMEGAGIAAAAQLHRVPFVEIRAISNVVGPRERASWRIADALAALRRAFGTMRGEWLA
jgi:futalosine hydrolase